MTSHPPLRRSGPLLLAIAWIAAACGSVNPSGSPAGSAEPVPPTASSPATGRPPGEPSAGLVLLAGGELLIVDADGIAEPVAGPGGPIEAISVAGRSIVAQTAGPAFHVASLPGGDVPPDWRRIAIDPTIAARPLGTPALSPDATGLALLAADVGSGEPFEVVVVDLATSAARVVPVDREPNGPPVWLDRSTVLLEVIAGRAGGPFARLDVPAATVAAVRAEGYSPALSGDGSVVAVLDGDDGSVRIVPVADWLAGASIADAATIDGSAGALHVAVDAAGGRVAFDTDGAGDEAAPSVTVATLESGRWVRAGVLNGEPATWLGWLP